MQEVLENYDYPGNIRELKNLIERLLVLSDRGEIHPEYLPIDMERGLSSRKGWPDPDQGGTADGGVDGGPGDGAGGPQVALGGVLSDGGLLRGPHDAARPGRGPERGGQVRA